jgi:(p)ppGpp synthase/HD superfamily hydrolase
MTDAAHPPRQLTARFREALWFSAFLHADQVRKGTGIPYVAHLLAVAALVLENGGGEDQAIAALLHDSAEDQGGTQVLDQIRNRFGSRVASIVEACSDTTIVPKPPWRERKERYIEHLADVSEDVLLISLSDKIHNATAILADYKRLGDDLWDRFQGGKAGTLWYYESLVEAFAGRGRWPELMAELKSVVMELRGLVDRAGM